MDVKNFVEIKLLFCYITLSTRVGAITMAELLAVNISPGGIPKVSQARAQVTADGLAGDGQEHAKHRMQSRAVCTLDYEIIEQLRLEGYEIQPGDLGENLTLRGCGGWNLAPGMRLRFSGGVVIELSEARKPCFVLDKIHPDLKEVTVGRIGWLASVVEPGWLSPGETVDLMEAV